MGTERTFRAPAAPAGRLLLRVLGALCVGALLAPWWPGVGASAAEEVADVGMGTEAWYYRDATIVDPPPEVEEPLAPVTGGLEESTAPVRQPVVEAANPYEGETLHVGVNAGQPEAHAFVAFPLSELDPTGQVVVTGGTVTLTASGLHERAPEEAEMVACAIEQPFSDELGGEWRDAPPFDCHFSSPLVLVPDSDPLVWTVELEPFAGLWSLPFQNHGIAVVPDPDSETSGVQASWHVAFHTRRYEQQLPLDPPPAPITATLTYEVESSDPPALTPLPPLDDGGAAPADGGSSPSVGFDLGAAQATGSLPATAGPIAGPEEEVAVPEAAAAAEEPDEEEVTSSSVARVPLDPVSHSSVPGRLSLLALALAGMTGYAYSAESELEVPERLRHLLRRVTPQRG